MFIVAHEVDGFMTESIDQQSSVPVDLTNSVSNEISEMPVAHIEHEHTHDPSTTLYVEAKKQSIAIKYLSIIFLSFLFNLN